MTSHRAFPQADYSEAATWVFPDSSERGNDGDSASSSRYAVRDYQVSISKQALFVNTLVCLPTGLGKTLIASVVMYNYYRWFPSGKVVFLAPTKPLVCQQIKACYHIMGLPEDETAYLEGSVSATKREQLWKDRRVFFCTPQTLHNDLSAGICDPRSVVCVVIDEAHRATSNYSYTTVIQELSRASGRFRVLALSATPGSDIRKIQNVIQNLQISHIEVRSESDPDIAPYIHERHIDVIPCKNGALHALNTVRKYVHQLMQRPLERLIAHHIIPPECTPQSLNIYHMQAAEGKLIGLGEQQHHSTVDAVTMQILETAFVELQALVTGLRQVNENGATALLDIMLKMKEVAAEHHRRNHHIRSDDSITTTSHFEQTVLIVKKSCSDASYLERREPKLSRLKEILCDHFHRHDAAAVSTRVLVFANLRAVVHEIKSEINEVRGVIAHEFVGQGTTKSISSSSSSIAAYDGEEKCPSSKGLNQSDQARILKDFNAGVYNVLVATSIAEEGLDIAEVDLIVFFEAVASSIRLVQRCGRTGRKRNGRVVILISEGIEEFKVDKSSDAAVYLGKTLRNASRSLQLYQDSPNMFPVGWPQPVMQMRDIKISAFRPDAIAGGMAKVGARSNKDYTDTTSAAENREKADATIRGGRNGRLFINRQALHPQPPPTDSSKGPAATSGSIAKFFSNQNQSFSTLSDMRPAVAGTDHQRAIASRTGSNGCDGRIVSQLSDAVLLHDHVAGNKMKTRDLGIDLTVDDDSLFGWSFAGIRQESHQSCKPTDVTFPKAGICKGEGRRNKLSSNTNLWSSSMLKQADIAGIIDDSEDIDSCDLFFEAGSTSRGSIRQAVSVSTAARPTTGDRHSTRAVPVVDVDLTVEASSDSSSCGRQQSMLMRCEKTIDAPILDATRSMIIMRPMETGAGGSQQSCFSNLTNIVRSVSQSRSFLVDDGDDDDDDDSIDYHVDDDAMDRHEESVSVQAPDDKHHDDAVPIDITDHALDDSGTACSSPIAITATNATTTGPTMTPLLDDDTMGSIHSDTIECDMNHICHSCLDWESYEHDPIVFCDGLCGSCVHVSCYGLLTHGVPDGDFFCESCEYLQKQQHQRCRGDDPLASSSAATKPSCALCFQATGSMKRCHRGLLWAHPLCVYFTPELTVSARTNRLNNIELLDRERSQLVCGLCDETGGAVVQCAYRDCLAAYHPYCAFQGRLQMVVRQEVEAGHPSLDTSLSESRVDDGTEGASTSYELYCRRHSGKCLHQHDSSTITGSRNPLRRRATASDASRRRHTKTKRTSIGIADLSSGESSATDDDGAVNRRAATGNRSRSSRGGARDEKGSNHPPFLRLKRSHPQPSSPADHRRKRAAVKDVRTFFDLEAVLSGSDSGDESIEERDDDDESSCISGDFINDGAYTQHPSQGDGTTQTACMYLAVNNYRLQMESPDDLDSHGKPNVRKIFRSKRHHHHQLSMQSSVVDSSGGTSYTSDDGMRSPIIEVPKGDPNEDDDDDEDGGGSNGPVFFGQSALQPMLKSKERPDHHPSDHHPPDHHPSAVLLPPIAKKLRFSTNAPPPLQQQQHRRRQLTVPDLDSSSDDSDDDDVPHVSCNPHSLKILRKCPHKNKQLVVNENALSSWSCRDMDGKDWDSGKGKDFSLPHKVNRKPLGVIAMHGNSKRSDDAIHEEDATLV